MVIIDRSMRCAGILLIFGLFFLLTLWPSGALRVSPAQEPLDYEAVVRELDMDRIQQHVLNLSNLETRFTGYPGNARASDYIMANLASLKNIVGLKKDFFNIVVPKEYRASLIPLTGENAGKDFKLYSVYPNLAITSTTPPEGITGKLVYVASMGDFQDFDGKDISGNIVLMDYGGDWARAALLGAKAVVFLEPEFIYRWETLSRYLDRNSLSFPRFYIPKEGTLQLLKLADQEVEVRLTSKVTWEWVQTHNILAYINGTQYQNEIIAITAHYDSWSVTPSLAPGAEEATGIALMLELARYFNNHPPKRTVMFIGWGGRGQGLAGARDFIEKYYFNPRGFSTIGSKIKIAFSLEFSSDANTLAALAYGDYYHVGLSGRNCIPLFNWLNNQIFNIYLPSIQQKLNKIFSFENGLINRATPIISYSDSIFDTEIFTWAGGYGVGLVTVKSARTAFNSPIDTYGRIEWQNLAPQFQLSTGILYSLLNETVLNMPNPTPIRFMSDPRSMGIGVVGGKVVRYDLTSGDYRPVPNALVILTEGVQFGGIGVLGEQGVSGYASRPVLFLVTMADSEGRFEFAGVKGGSGGAYFKSYILYAYGLNSTTGMIEYAMDMGEFGTRQFDNIVSMVRLTGIENVTLAVFRCGVMTAYGLISPEGFVGGITAPQILDASSHTPPQSWGYEYLGWGSSMVYIFYLPEKTPIEIFFGYGYLSNMGKGFSAKVGEALQIYFTPLQALEDLYILDEERLIKAHLLAVFSEGGRAERFHAQAYLRLDLIQEALDDREYSKAWAQAIQGWGSEIRAYRFTLSMTMDSIVTVTFYVALLIPFTLLFERMVSSSHGLRRLINIIAIFNAALLPIFLLHPGTSLASNPPMIVVGLVILFLSAPVAAIFYLKFSEYLTQIQTRLRGAHFAAISRLALALISLDVGVSQMKKRPLRTTLTLITVTLVVFSLVTLTSSQYYAEAFPVEIIRDVQTPYNGLLITQGGYDVLPNLFLEYLKAAYSENFSICPRTWIFPPFGSVTLPLRFPVFRGENESGVISLMGMAPEEEADPIFQLSLESGSRWFTTYDTFACIIPTPLAQKIGAQMGDTIKVWGYNFTVIGIFTPEILDGQKDLSQMRATPLDPYVTQQVQGMVTGQRIPASELILIPFNTARKLGGGVNQIALIASKPVDEGTLRQMGQELAYQIPALFVFTGYESEVRLYRLRFVLTTSGYELLTFPVVVAMLVLLTTMLGIVQERQKDIFTYGSLGISPMNMSLMFLCESTTFAIVGATFGYIAGTVFLILGQSFLPAQSLALNYSSRFVLLSVTLAILGTIGSSLYPLFVAGRLVTPSLERKWKIAKPYGDKWTIILPFQADYKEALGVLSYLKEYIESISIEARSQQKFAIESVTYEVKEETRALAMTVALAPIELGVSQMASLIAAPSKEKDMWGFQLYCQLQAGPTSIWQRSNRYFIDAMRKQILMWRSLTPRSREEYISKADRLTEGKVGS